MAKSDTKILLLAGSTDLNIKVLYCLYPVFKNIHVVVNHSNSVIKYSRYRKKFDFIHWSLIKGDQVKSVADLQEYCKIHEIEVILPGDIAASGFMNKHKDVFSAQKTFPTMSADELERIDNKWLFGQDLMKAGLSTPETILIEKVGDISDDRKSEIEEKIGFPLILKPLFGEASHGIEKITSFDGLKMYAKNKISEETLPILLQTYIDGYDVGYSVLAEQGEVKTKAVQLIEQEDVLEYCRREDIEALGEKIVKLINYSGPANFDMRIDYHTGEIYVIECNPRFWFTITSAMWQGLNFPEAAVNYAAGNEYNKDGAEGIIRAPGLAMKLLIKKPWRYFSTSKNQRGSIWQPLLDPIPHLVKYFRS